MAVLFLPLIQSRFKLFKLQPLKGAITFPAPVDLKLEDWFSSKYQEEQEKYLNEKFGFRSTCIRINNQIAFSLFNYAKANGVVIGKENYLYEESYINAYIGKDFVGQDSINHTLARLKYLNDILKNNNKQLIIVFAPGKGTYYPEYIPNKYLEHTRDNTNYKAMLIGAKKSGLNVIDFNFWFKENKAKSKYPLFPKHGIHWSTYSAALVSDSIIKFIEKLRGIDMPDFSCVGVEKLPASEGDRDIGDGMNLFTELIGFDMGYPILQVSNTEKTKPNVLVISDSFYWAINGYQFQQCFDKHNFWYYNKEVHSENSHGELLTDSLNTCDEILKNDIIIVMATEANLKNIGWGFIERAERDFNLKGYTIEGSRSVLINKWKLIIKNNPTWMEKINKDSKARKISIDSAITLDAMWKVKQL